MNSGISKIERHKMAVQAKKKKQQVSKLSFLKGMSRRQTGVVVFALVFGFVGIYTLLSSSAMVSKGARSAPTLTVSPNPVKVDYINLVVAGCGYTPGSLITLNYYPVNAPGATFSLGFAGTEPVNSAGCLS